jgi:hypothetical protein
MIIAHIVVDGAPDPADNKSWGQFSFVALPRPGEQIEVPYDGFMERLRIQSVEHRPAPHPLPKNQTLLRAEAQAFIYASWAGHR